MSHVNLHLALGLGAGAALAAVPLARAWLADRPIARPIAVMIALSCALGVWAIVPNVLGRLGVHIGASPWADVFLLHRAINYRVHGGLLIGELAIATIMVVQYVIILAAVVRARRRRPSVVP